MTTTDRTRKKIHGLLGKLRSSGFKVVFEQGEQMISGEVKVAVRGQEVYIGALDPDQKGLFLHYHDTCRRGGPDFKNHSSSFNSTVTLKDGTFYQCFREYPKSVPGDIIKLLERGHEFDEAYMAKLNSGC